MVLSHAHIDHSGRIPVLTSQGFSGRILCTRATADACEYLLLDSAHIQESDAAYLNYKAVRSVLQKIKTSPRTKKVTQRGAREIKQLLKKKRHELNLETIDRLIEEYHIDGVLPLYSTFEAEQSLDYFDGFPYRHPVTIGRDMTCTFYEAGHILGSAVSLIRARENGRSLTVLYTGDLGRFDKPIIRDPCLNFPEEDREVDLMIMESTYGNRRHGPVQDIKALLKQALTETVERGGSMVIPAFAFGRTQELLYVIHELHNEGEIPEVPIYVDSPLASKLTRVFGEHPEVYDRETHATFLEQGMNPFRFQGVHFVGSVEESMALNRESGPHVVIAASGMCEAGRVLHHLRYKIHNPRNTILIVGFMAENTLGRRIVEQGRAYEAAGRNGPPPLLKFLGKEYPLQARVVELDGFSAHGDKEELLRILKQSNLKVKKIAVVHGEEAQSVAFAETLGLEGFDAFVPHVGETVSVG